MNTGTKLAAFAAGLAVVFGVMFGVGKAIGPWDIDTPPAHGTEHHTETGHHMETGQ